MFKKLSRFFGFSKKEEVLQDESKIDNLVEHGMAVDESPKEPKDQHK
jgi:flagellar biosynthesis regulator FlbT